MMVADEEWMQGLTMAVWESNLVMLHVVHGHWSSDVVDLNTDHVMLAYLSRKKNVYVAWLKYAGHTSNTTPLQLNIML